MEQTKTFTEGLIVKRNDNAPDFVTANISIKVDEFKAFLDTHNNNGWVNIQLKRAKSGKYYGELDTFKPKQDDDIF